MVCYPAVQPSRPRVLQQPLDSQRGPLILFSFINGRKSLVSSPAHPTRLGRAAGAKIRTIVAEAILSQSKHAVAETISWFHVLRPVEQAQTKAAAQDRIAVVQRSASPAAAGAPEPATGASKAFPREELT